MWNAENRSSPSTSGLSSTNEVSMKTEIKIIEQINIVYAAAACGKLHVAFVVAATAHNNIGVAQQAPGKQK